MGARAGIHPAKLEPRPPSTSQHEVISAGSTGEGGTCDLVSFQAQYLGPFETHLPAQGLDFPPAPTLLPQPPSALGLQVCITTPGQIKVLSLGKQEVMGDNRNPRVFVEEVEPLF